jgi:hypothetical protein
MSGFGPSTLPNPKTGQVSGDRTYATLPPQGLEALSEVVGVEERFEVFSELAVGLVVIAPNGCFLEGARFIRST